MIYKLQKAFGFGISEKEFCLIEYKKQYIHLELEFASASPVKDSNDLQYHLTCKNCMKVIHFLVFAIL